MTEQKIALVIGTNNYKDPGLKLDFAEDDARAMKEILSNPILYGFKVTDLIDVSHIIVSKKIEELLTNAQQEDFILIYFSGHGKLDDQNDLYLFLNDTEMNYFRTTSLRFDIVNKFMETSKSKTIIMIIDSCYSGAAGAKGGGDVTKAFSGVSGSDRIILSASSGFEIAKEDKDLKHGIFTNYLLEGLEGEAGTDKRGQISIDELYNYTYKKTRERNPKQNPMKKGEPKGEIIIGRNPKIVKENIYKDKLDKLINKTKVGLLMDYYDISFTILSKVYKDTVPLTDYEDTIRPFLDALINDKISVNIFNGTISELYNPRKDVLKDKINELTISAQHLYNEGKYPDAIDVWKKVLELDPENINAIDGIKNAKLGVEEKVKKASIDELNISAQQLFQVKKYSEAIDKWKEVLNLDPENKTAKDGIKNSEEENKKKKPVAFMSYVHFDDRSENGRITQFREFLSTEVKMQTGEDFSIFQDRQDIAWGVNWKELITKSIDNATFLIPIITPGFFKSKNCREELELFIKREKDLKRNDLILPVYYVSTPLIDDPENRIKDNLAQIIADHQFADWRKLRFEDMNSIRIKEALEGLAIQIRKAMERLR